MMNTILKMGIEISTAPGPVLKPVFLNISTANSTRFTSLPNTPFKYYTDAIIGLCYHKMTDFKFLDPQQRNFVETAYNNLNPYVELSRKSAPRLHSLTKNKSRDQQLQLENLEKALSDQWQILFTTSGVDFTKIPQVLQIISDFESSWGAPFLYDFNLEFSPSFKEKLICFHAFLFNLRSVVAIDHNAYVEDSSIENLHCDCISDYLPKSDYTVNDALLFLQFKKLSTPFVHHKDKDVRIEKLFVQPLEKYFYKYNHNACCLIDQLPMSFFNNLSSAEFEESLHRIQMDWLLGSAAGFLFKIREELFGITSGYDQIFWPNAAHTRIKSSSKLMLHFQITSEDLAQDSLAA